MGDQDRNTYFELGRFFSGLWSHYFNPADTQENFSWTTKSSLSQDFKIKFSCDILRQISEIKASDSFRRSNSSMKLIVLLFLCLAALCSRCFMVSYWADSQVLTQTGVPLRRACLCSRNSSGRDWTHIACPQFCKNFSFKWMWSWCPHPSDPRYQKKPVWLGERNILPQVCKVLRINHII